MIDVKIRKEFVKILSNSRKESCDPCIELSTESVEVAYGSQFNELQTIINKYDPMNLFCFGAPEHEYSLEVKTIIIQLDKGMTIQQVLKLIHQEFIRWFGVKSTGSISEYSEMSSDVFNWAMKRNLV